MKLLQDFTNMSLILRFKLSAQCFWRGMRLLRKAVQAVNVRNFSLDTSVLSTPSPKAEHLPPLSCLCSQLFVLVLKKTPTILNCSTNHCTCPEGAVNATLLYLTSSTILLPLLEMMMWIPLYQCFLSWLSLCQSPQRSPYDRLQTTGPHEPVWLTH